MPNEPASPGRAIVTYSRGFQSLSAIRSLGARGIEVVAGDEYRITPGALSRHAVASFTYPAPTVDPDGFLDALVEAIETHRPAHPDTPYVLAPMHTETLVIARAAERFRGRIAFALPRPDQIDRVEHKGSLARFARAHGIPVPPTWTPRDPDELDRVLPEIEFPVFVKIPRGGSAGVGVEKADDADELRAAFRDLCEQTGSDDAHRPIVQGFVPGDDYCVTALFDHGERITSLTYKNVLTFPQGNGPGAIRETVDGEALEEHANRLLGELGWHGIAEVDFRWTGKAEDEPHILEVNPRFFGGLFQAIESGVDYPSMYFDLALGRKVERPDEVRVGTRTEAPVLGLLATIMEIADQEGGLEALETHLRDARHELAAGRGLAALRAVTTGLRESLDLRGRIEAARSILRDNSENLGVLFDAQDPLPVLGLVYPLAVFLRHGKITPELMTGSQGAETSH